MLEVQEGKQRTKNKKIIVRQEEKISNDVRRVGGKIKKQRIKNNSSAGLGKILNDVDDREGGKIKEQRIEKDSSAGLGKILNDVDDRAGTKNNEYQRIARQEKNILNDDE